MNEFNRVIFMIYVEQIKSFKLNSIKYEQIRQKEIFNTNLIQIENSIKEYLFGGKYLLKM